MASRWQSMVGDYLAEHWADKEIAILDDGTSWPRASLTASDARLRGRGVRAAVEETITPGDAEYSALV
jgi:branched-chain amino acid transport system substrate-binding protein